MRYQQATRTATRQRMGAKLIAAGNILELSGLELQQRIDQELSVNPALELSDEPLCPICHARLRDGRCPNCAYRAVASSPDDDAIFESFAAPSRADDDADPTARAQVPVTLHDHLRLQARLALSRADYTIAAYLIANTSDRGLLEAGLDELSRESAVPVDDLARIQRVLQGLDPIGVCSSSPQEAVLAQVRQLAAEQAVPPLVEPIIADHWHDLANHTYAKIAKALRVKAAQVEAAVAFMRANLNPYPGNQFHADWSGDPYGGAVPVQPDVVIHHRLDEYHVEVLESAEYVLRVSDSYRELQRTSAGAAWPPAEWKQAVEMMRRADWFIHSIRMRRRTLRQVTECIVAAQTPYLDTGLEERLQPLTRSQVAIALGKHESTVSRAIANKFALLPPPSNRVVPLDHFFTPSLGIKSQIELLIERESPDNPLTDEQICQILATRGHALARRTVAKYRLALRIPSSEQRGRR